MIKSLCWSHRLQLMPLADWQTEETETASAGGSSIMEARREAGRWNGPNSWIS